VLVKNKRKKGTSGKLLVVYQEIILISEPSVTHAMPQEDRA